MGCYKPLISSPPKLGTSGLMDCQKYARFVATYSINEKLVLSYQTFDTFPSLSYLSYLLTLCSLYQFLSLYQSFVVLSNICHLLAPCYLFTFYVIWQPINALPVHTTNTTLFLVLSCARPLRQFTFLTHQASLAIVLFWCGGIEAWLGFFFT